MQQHRELELMSSFRERFGCDWLQYRNHLEASALSTLSPDAPSPGPAPSPPPPEKDSPQEVAEEVWPEPEPREEEELEKQGEEELEKQGEEEGGEEQSEVEGERSLAVRGPGARWWSCVRESGEPKGGDGWPPHSRGRITVSHSLSLLSGALPAHVGVSPRGARGRAGQGVLSLGHYGPPV